MQRTSGVVESVQASPDLTPYAVGVSCTWNDTAGNAGVLGIAGNVKLRCPRCLGAVRVTTVEAWLSDVQHLSKSVLQFSAMVAWSRGRCFPDYETLESAWRQAREE